MTNRTSALIKIFPACSERATKKNWRPSIVSLLFLIFLSLLIFSCNQEGEDVIIDNPCSPPCWRNITPGKTEQEELIQILEKMPDVNNKNLKILGPWNIFENHVEVSLVSGPEVCFYITDNRVVLIVLHGDFGLTDSEAIEYFGNPDIITASRILGPSRFLFGDSPLLYISSMMQRSGVGFGFSTGDIEMKSDEEIRSDSKITEFYYFDPDSFQTLLEGGLFTMGNTWDFKYWRSNQD